MQWFNMVQVLALVLVATTSGVAASNSGLSTSATAAAGGAIDGHNGVHGETPTGATAAPGDRLKASPAAKQEGGDGDDDEEVQSEPKYNADGTIVVSKYYKNGVKQRLAHWWNSLVSQRPARRLREA